MHVKHVSSTFSQISPFPFDLVGRERLRFPEAHIVWAQEEPKNMGAWSYVQPRFATASHSLRDIKSVNLCPYNAF